MGLRPSAAAPLEYIRTHIPYVFLPNKFNLKWVESPFGFKVISTEPYYIPSNRLQVYKGL